jgi:hypothetical protein
MKTPENAVPKRRFQFTIGTLMLITTVICVRLAVRRYQNRNHLQTPWMRMEIPIDEPSYDRVESALRSVAGLDSISFDGGKMVVVVSRPNAPREVMKTLADHNVEVKGYRGSANMAMTRLRKKERESAPIRAP